MKKILFILFLIVASLIVDAQVNFMGIPVDGPKKEMISKLESKGFTKEYSCLEIENAQKKVLRLGGTLTNGSILENDETYMMDGMFDGKDCWLMIFSYNKNVYQIFVGLKFEYNENRAKSEYNYYAYMLSSKYNILDKELSEIFGDKYHISQNEDLYKPFEKIIHCSFFDDNSGFIELQLSHPRYKVFYISFRYISLHNTPKGEDL